MDYRILTQDEQDDIIVSFQLSQEKDAFCHETNIVRFTKMLKSLPKGEWRDKIAQLRVESMTRLAEVSSLIEATKGQLPPVERLEASKLRVGKKES